MPTSALLALYGSILAELRARDIVRSQNPPAADYAEWLVWKAFGGTLAPKSAKGWDVRTDDGTHLQVKARVLADAAFNRSVQLSFVRSWTFDQLAVVFFRSDYSVGRAVLLPTQVVRDSARRAAYVSGDKVVITSELLRQGVDVTVRLVAVAAAA
jgi:hypothetical protein